MKITYIFDFDSTLVDCEVLKQTLVQAGCSEAERFLLDQITNDGMEGKISFRESINRRLAIAKLTPELVEKTNNAVAKRVVEEFRPYLSDIWSRGDKAIIVSGCPRQLIRKAYQSLGFKDEEVYCLEFDENLKVKESLLLEDHGKSKVINSLDLGDSIKVMIGDGANDLDTFQQGAVDLFICFTGVVHRDNIINQAPLVTNHPELAVNFWKLRFEE